MKSVYRKTISVIIMKLIFLLIFCFSQWAFSCPAAFVESYETRRSRSSRVTLLTPKEELMDFSKRDVQDLSYVEVLNLLFNKNVPLQLINFLGEAQVNGLISRSRKLKDPKNENVFFVFIRINLHLVSPRNISLIPKSIIRELLVYDIKRLSPQQISALTATQIEALTPHQIRVLNQEQIQAFTPEQIGVLSREQIQAFTPEQIVFFGDKIQYFSNEQLGYFLSKQIDAILPSQAEVLKSNQRRHLIRLVQ